MPDFPRNRCSTETCYQKKKIKSLNISSKIPWDTKWEWRVFHRLWGKMWIIRWGNNSQKIARVVLTKPKQTNLSKPINQFTVYTSCLSEGWINTNNKNDKFVCFPFGFGSIYDLSPDRPVLVQKHPLPVHSTYLHNAW